MGKNKHFNRKQTVRFTLVPGFDSNGKPAPLYKPIENRKSKLNEKQKNNIINQIGDYDQI